MDVDEAVQHPGNWREDIPMDAAQAQVAVPDWVEGTRKRLRERRDAHVKETAAKAARTKEERHAILRASYPDYAVDLERVKAAIQQLLPHLELKETVWVALKNKDGVAEISLFGPVPAFVEHTRTNVSAKSVSFRLPTIVAWSRQLSMTPGVLWTMAVDLGVWAEALSLEAKTEECNAGDVRIPGTHLYIVDADEENPPRGMCKGDYLVAIAVPLEPVQKRGRTDISAWEQQRFDSLRQQDAGPQEAHVDLMRSVRAFFGGDQPAAVPECAPVRVVFGAEGPDVCVTSPAAVAVAECPAPAEPVHCYFPEDLYE